MLSGFINILKPPGLTSHAVVARVRRLLGERRVGHAGTLDPAASGVLVVAVGRATRLIAHLEGSKTYRGEITFGIGTTTLDAEGEITRAVPCSVAAAQLREVLPRFRGTIDQVPPMVSAVHHQGRRLYELARSGVEVERQPRRVHITRLELISFYPDPLHPRALIECTCSAGTYVRALAADIGRALGTEAHLSFLLRTRSGSFALDSSLTLAELEAAVGRGVERTWLCPPESGLGHLAAVTLPEEESERFRHGNAVFHPSSGGPALGQALVVYGPGRSFLGVGRLEHREEALWLQPDVVFPKEC
ncbi:tRNA pseudouridine(55) synthase TruB [Gelria sp. Kuro-4]|uniref:tRNA pseudouridine(55) synthase TruB n=1 Tax=Gelria sp. Kuro-4 TaxID=2796927 RepID=UPI001BEDA0C6|nr:tRNA pseudouridine(55) synthase TruB [Gelria sp. Kuro-4]BCV24976.1 tRNA pseudouridine synthase B [Gelria sp. Kuro-4]